MSYNVHVDFEMYNSELKEKFLNKHTDTTKQNYGGFFLHSKSLEIMYGKDLFEFTLEQIGELMYSYNPSTLIACSARLSAINQYINWSIANGYKSNNINPLDIMTKEWKKQFVSTEIKYYPKSIIDEVLKDAINYQDIAIVSLLFEGINGKALCEIRNLTIHDVDGFNSQLRVKTDDGIARIVKVSENCIHLVQQAYTQRDYFNNNGNMSENTRTSASRDLLDTGYVFKPVRGRNKYFGQLSEQSIYGRLKTLAEHYELIHLKKTLGVIRSGMIYMGKQLLERDGVLDKEQLLEICEQFGISEVMRNGKMDTQWHGLREFVNVEMIKKLYSD